MTNVGCYNWNPEDVALIGVLFGVSILTLFLLCCVIHVAVKNLR